MNLTELHPKSSRLRRHSLRKVESSPSAKSGQVSICLQLKLPSAAIRGWETSSPITDDWFLIQTLWPQRYFVSRNSNASFRLLFSFKDISIRLLICHLTKNFLSTRQRKQSARWRDVDEKVFLSVLRWNFARFESRVHDKLFLHEFSPTQANSSSKT